MLDVALRNLRDFKKAAEEQGMRFMLADGTLLGAYRDKGFVEGDEGDIDLMIMDHEFYKITDVMNGLKGFEFTKEFDVGGVFQGGALVRGTNHIDLMRMVALGDSIVNYGEGGNLIYKYPKDIFNKYSKIDFYGVTYDAPGDIERFLEARYGNWMIPVSKEDYSYKDPKYSPNVSDIHSYQG